MTEQRPGGQTLFERLQAVDPERTVADTAVETLRDPQEMRLFL